MFRFLLLYPYILRRVFSLTFNKKVSKTVESFYLATNMPIQALKLDGHSISSAGYNNRLSRLFDCSNVYERIKIQLPKDNEEFNITISCRNDIYFTAIPICPRNIYRGFFVLGPYSSRANHNMNIVYKPISIIPHLISFIPIIFTDCGCKKYHPTDDIAYGLHVRKAVDYIDARYSDNITLSNVSDYLGINKSYFASIFKKETGKTFTQYLNQLRVKKSKKLLLENNSSILDVALAVGFNSQNYYNIMFKRITNKSPLEFINNPNS